VSGGGTLYMKWGADNIIVTSAVYGEREIKKEYKIF
jgi:hypothetical protein